MIAINVLLKQWWVSLIVIALCSGYFFIPNQWWFWGTAIAVVLFVFIVFVISFVDRFRLR